MIPYYIIYGIISVFLSIGNKKIQNRWLLPPKIQKEREGKYVHKTASN